MVMTLPLSKKSRNQKHSKALVAATPRGLRASFPAYLDVQRQQKFTP
jgi:hypothetical protein